ncbi:actin cytoskeleton-regulatory complex protein pan1-like [Pyrus ussuriensis x Pyrus communis]|uniref:Actin cytoskeleton-regulatory complex protein pan1-like n=1 Tax=Pyrus ussuriensis x Pyrus communis TaxID=2448454 RepID=A0A5N5H4W5_9ROSA|nr:actin cytoskeleton-regulatory complex protein pan1-like [Pyrus ussuriensis x Pyrus communis]
MLFGILESLLQHNSSSIMLQPHLNQGRIFLLATYLSHQPLCQYLLGPSLQLAQVPMLVASLSRPSHLQKQTSRSPTSATGVSSGAGNSASSQSHLSWPRMTQTDVQKYTSIFVKGDTHRDGKITDAQARDLFLKWGRPRGSTIFFVFIYWLVFYRHICHVVIEALFFCLFLFMFAVN